MHYIKVKDLPKVQKTMLLSGSPLNKQILDNVNLPKLLFSTKITPIVP